MNQLLVLTLSALIIFSCDSNREIKRPRDPWVFRSVLDKRPRMVTAMLHENLNVAYDAQRCQLYKAWKGGVIFDGAVYTTKHGPQPTSKGYAYFTDDDQPVWSFTKDGKDEPATPQFRGYRIDEGHVTFKYQLTSSDGSTVIVEETPEFEQEGEKVGFKRTFKIGGGDTGSDLTMRTKLSSMSKEDDYETDGQLKKVSASKRKIGQNELNDAAVELKLNRDKETNLTVYFHPGFDVEEELATQALDPIAKGAQLIDGSDCKTCHNEKVKTVGPSYLEVAKKYDASEANTKMLVSKIIKGGTGNWGEVPMTPHPDLKEDDATLMVNYIMTLDGEKPKDQNATVDYSAGSKPVGFAFDDKNEFEKKEDKKDYPGLAGSIYKFESREANFYDIPKTTDPIYTAEAPQLHFGDELFGDDYRQFSTNVLFHFKGFLNIENEDNYVLRLVSDDGSKMWLDGKEVINNDGMHGAQARDAELVLKKGKHPVEVIFYQGGGGLSLSLQWAKHGDPKFTVIPTSALGHQKSDYKKSAPYVPMTKLTRNVPGDRRDEAGVHPSFEVQQARPKDFLPKVGGLDFLSDSSLIVCTWDSTGSVYQLKGANRSNPEAIKVTRIASGLAEPLGLKVVDDTIYVLQKQELTKLIDHDDDGDIDEYQTVCNGWKVSANFHEFAFGLAYKDGYFYGTLATAINPGGASTKPQIPDRGKVVKISKKDGSFELIASGLRTPNGINVGVDGELFVTDNQGDWLPSSKVVHVTEGAWFGSRSVDFEGTATLKEKPPVVWLPQDEIGNSPSQPVAINLGPYKGQQLHGEVTHGGLKRVFMEKINGEYQGAVFRFTQGLDGGVNRVVWGPDNTLYIGMIGNPGNWATEGGKWYGLQKLKWTGRPAFEMLAVRARTNGVEIELTEPISEDFGNAVEAYEVRQWRYQPTEDYGGPKLDEKILKIKSLNISEDRKKVFLELDGMKAGHVVYVRLKGSFISTEGRSLWATEGWYTMNQIPQNLPGFKRPVQAPVPNTLTEKEKAEGWTLLFDGKTTKGWRNFKSDKIGNAWRINDGAIHLDNTKKNDWQTSAGGDIITEKEYENYELKIDWKIQKCGNSGIIFNVVEDDKYDYVWRTGPEMQVLDNTCHPDGRFVKHRAGDLYDLIESKFVAVNPAGEWNEARIVANQGKYEFWLNGHQIVSFDITGEEWRQLVAGSKFKDMPDFGKARKGHISLQDHGDKVWYRNIKIREIK